jgi:hypothetical protein
MPPNMAMGGAGKKPNVDGFFNQLFFSIGYVNNASVRFFGGEGFPVEEAAIRQIRSS